MLLIIQTGLMFFISFIVVALVVQWYRNRPRNLPPGPWGLPVVGSIFSLGKQPHLTLMEMAKTYGNVFSINLGGQRVVVLNGFKAVREALVKNAEAFAGRPHLVLTQELTEGQGKKQSDFSVGI